MADIFHSFEGVLAALLIAYVAFLALGINLLPAWLSGRVGVAIAGAAIAVGGAQMF
jgi:hypothetical protein